MIRTVFFTDLPTAQAELITHCAPAEFAVEIHSSSLPDAEKIALLSEAEFLILFPGRLSDTVLESAPHLRLIQLVSAGFEQMNLDLCKKLAIPVANNGGTNAIDVAEHVLALSLGLYRRLIDLDRSVRSGQWDAVSLGAQTQTIYGKTLGIVGFGHIGQRVARLFSALGAELLYSDPTPAEAGLCTALSIRPLPLDQLLAAADIVTLHVPLMDSTRRLIGPAQLSRMKRNALLINTSRGPVIDEAALYQALSAGHIAGAALDVFGTEPCPADHPLLGLPNVLLSPHAAGVTRDTWARRGAFVFANLQRVWAGHPPEAEI